MNWLSNRTKLLIFATILACPALQAADATTDAQRAQKALPMPLGTPGQRSDHNGIARVLRQAPRFGLGINLRGLTAQRPAHSRTETLAECVDRELARNPKNQAVLRDLLKRAIDENDEVSAQKMFADIRSPLSIIKTYLELKYPLFGERQNDAVTATCFCCNLLQDAHIDVLTLSALDSVNQKLFEKKGNKRRVDTYAIGAGLSKQIFNCIECNDTFWVTQLLKAHPCLAAVRTKNGDTPLHIAAQKGNQEIVKKLLEALGRFKVEVLVLAKNKAGKTPKDLAQDPSIIQLLLAQEEEQDKLTLPIAYALVIKSLVADIEMLQLEKELILSVYHKQQERDKKAAGARPAQRMSEKHAHIQRSSKAVVVPHSTLVVAPTHAAPAEDVAALKKIDARVRLPREILRVDGIEYTPHAQMRMLPKTPEVLQALRQEALRLGFEPDSYELRCFVDPRDIAYETVSEIIANNEPRPDGDKYRYQDEERGIAVVVAEIINAQGGTVKRVVTVMRTRPEEVL